MTIGHMILIVVFVALMVEISDLSDRVIALEKHVGITKERVTTKGGTP